MTNENANESTTKSKINQKNNINNSNRCDNNNGIRLKCKMKMKKLK